MFYILQNTQVEVNKLLFERTRVALSIQMIFEIGPCHDIIVIGARRRSCAMATAIISGIPAFHLCVQEMKESKEHVNFVNTAIALICLVYTTNMDVTC